MTPRLCMCLLCLCKARSLQAGTDVCRGKTKDTVLSVTNGYVPEHVPAELEFGSGLGPDLCERWLELIALQYY